MVTFLNISTGRSLFTPFGKYLNRLIYNIPFFLRVFPITKASQWQLEKSSTSNGNLREAMLFYFCYHLGDILQATVAADHRKREEAWIERFRCSLAPSSTPFTTASSCRPPRWCFASHFRKLRGNISKPASIPEKYSLGRSKRVITGKSVRLVLFQLIFGWVLTLSKLANTTSPRRTGSC